jgi:hypothetical protein
MKYDNPRMVLFQAELCNHAGDLELHIDDIARHLLPENAVGLCQSYFENEAAAMQYLCAIGIGRARVREYLDVAAKMFILCATYSSATLTEACQRVAEDAAKGDLDRNVLAGLAALHGIVFMLEPHHDSPEGEERTSARPCEVEAIIAPVPQVPECITRERGQVSGAIQHEAERRIRSRLLLSHGKNICCNTLGEVGTSSKIRGDGSVFAYAEFMCPVCKTWLSSVSEVYRI